MCSNDNIFIFPLANRLFPGYVSSGRRVGEVSQTMYARRGNKQLFVPRLTLSGDPPNFAFVNSLYLRLLHD